MCRSKTRLMTRKHCSFDIQHGKGGRYGYPVGRIRREYPWRVTESIHSEWSSEWSSGVAGSSVQRAPTTLSVGSTLLHSLHRDNLHSTHGKHNIQYGINTVIPTKPA